MFLEYTREICYHRVHLRGINGEEDDYYNVKRLLFKALKGQQNPVQENCDID